jgi:hypothetical protein
VFESKVVKSEVVESESQATGRDYKRIVLVREDSLDWQKGRNGSGMKTLQELRPGDPATSNYIEDILCKRLTGL